MNENNDFALVPRLPSAVEKAEPGAKRILASSVAETLSLARAKTPAQPITHLPHENIEELEEWNRKGNAYYDGTGVPQDYVEAVKWYRRAAERGYAPAQFNLARCYACGLGVAKDYFKQAKAWHLKAAERGHAVAQFAESHLKHANRAKPTSVKAVVVGSGTVSMMNPVRGIS